MDVDVADPVTAEIIRNALVAITDEMKTNLMRTAYNQIIYEALDYTVGLFDADGNTISIGLGLPMFIRGLSDAIKAKLAHYGRDGIEPGDILLTNDAYIMGSHLNHMIFTLPIFHDGKLVAFSSSMAHWHRRRRHARHAHARHLLRRPAAADRQDLQARRAGRRADRASSAPTCASRSWRWATSAPRSPPSAPAKRATARCSSKYGPTAVDGSIAGIVRAQRAACARRGRAHSRRHLRCRLVHGRRRHRRPTPIPINVKVVVDGDRMTIDLSEVSPQVAGLLQFRRDRRPLGGASRLQVPDRRRRCTRSTTARFARSTIVLPPGRVVSAVKPAAMRWWMTIPMTIVDTIFRALAPAIPERVAAGHHADLCVGTMYGINPRTGRFFVGSTIRPGGGWGAKHDSDGMSAVVCINDGDTHNAVIEALEAKLPVVVERYALRPDSGGAGRCRGGLGLELRVRALGADACRHARRAHDCARPGAWPAAATVCPTACSIVRAGGRTFAFRNGKIEERLEPGDALVIESGGGGGFGDPRERPRERLLADVRSGYVSPEAAVGDYGLPPEVLP